MIPRHHLPKGSQSRKPKSSLFPGKSSPFTDISTSSFLGLPRTHVSPSKSLSSKRWNILAYSSAVLAIMLSEGGWVVQAIQIVLLRIVPNDGRFDVVFSTDSFESCTISPPHRHRHPTIDPHREFQRSLSEQALGLPQCEFLLPVNMDKSSLRCLSIDYRIHL